MKSLLKNLKQFPNNQDLITQLSNSIRKNWNYYSPEKPYSYLSFSETFSNILIDIESGKIKTPNELLRSFQRLYYREMNILDKSISKLPSGDTELEIDMDLTVKVSRLKFDDLQPFEFLILHDALIRLSKNELVKDPTTLSVLGKLRLNHYSDVYSLPKIVNNMNYGSLYLLNELGIRKFLEFTNLLDLLGINYQPLVENDEDLSIKLKQTILEKFSGLLDHVEIKDLPLLEKLME